MILKTKRLILLVIGTLGLVSCTSHYQVNQANRAQYPINQSLPPDSGIIKTYLPYKQKLDAEMNAIVGKTTTALSKGNEGESALANFFADACLISAKKIDPNIDFAIPSTNGGIRSSLPKGNITLTNVYELMPFENELWVLTIKGSDVADFAQFVAQSKGQPISGISLKINNNQAVDVLINGKPLDQNKNYRVLTSDYIAGGGNTVSGLAHPIAKKVLNLKVRDAILQYIKDQTAANKTISPVLDGRISNN